ncbi:MAG: methylated-DNA--[protein]-cysteine S-methyltransferase [Magnetococcales bacterium]|nr:methylated-DNA--[protein]-cysteine S-methyltransferase [Magnetococcales bacterium]
MWLHTRNHTIVALSPHPPLEPPEEPLQTQVQKWLTDYFSGHIQAVTNLPLAPPGTPFQQRVWQQLHTIPPSQTETYGSLAHTLNTAPRAVGTALAANPIPILIPCHRVVAAHGPGGYSGIQGITGKCLLLQLEKTTVSFPLIKHKNPRR